MGRQGEGTDAFATDRITLYIQIRPESHRRLGVEEFGKRLLMDIAQRAMKKTGAHRAVRLDDRRDPRCIADGYRKISLAIQRLKVAREPA